MTADIFGLLTRFRVPESSMDMERAADKQHFFPLVGLVVGLLVAIAVTILSSQLDEGMALVTGGLAIGLMYLMNGMMHTEGLADFADAIMTGGSQDRKRETMKDPHCGVGGVFAVVLYLILLFAVVATLCANVSADATNILPWSMTAVAGFALAEMAGKLAMVTSMYMGPSSHEGMGSIFVAKSNSTKLLVAIAIASGASFFLTGLYFPIVLAGVVAGVLVTAKARKELGGVSGDVFGAANEIGRIVALFCWVLIL
jgi:adenosylcobinamide-GDP ribazoletransferase